MKYFCISLFFSKLLNSICLFIYQFFLLSNFSVYFFTLLFFLYSLCSRWKQQGFETSPIHKINFVKKDRKFNLLFFKILGRKWENKTLWTGLLLQSEKIKTLTLLNIGLICICCTPFKVTVGIRYEFTNGTLEVFLVVIKSYKSVNDYQKLQQNFEGRTGRKQCETRVRRLASGNC